MAEPRGWTESIPPRPAEPWAPPPCDHPADQWCGLCPEPIDSDPIDAPWWAQ
jgi:hypothetical protein